MQISFLKKHFLRVILYIYASQGSKVGPSLPGFEPTNPLILSQMPQGLFGVTKEYELYQRV